MSHENTTTGTTEKEKQTSKKDTQSRKYFLTINNPAEHSFLHSQITKILTEFTGIKYFCMADEQGESYHTHIYAVFNTPVRFSTIKKHFYQAHIEPCLGNSEQNRAYIAKEGKWADDVKHGTKIEGTFEEWGELPQERQGARNDLSYLYEKVKDGFSNYEILEDNPDFMLRLTDIERTRQTIKAEENRNIFRELTVTYIWGQTATGKTRYVMEKYGYGNVFRVTDYKHPFDAYKGEEVILFDEFSNSLKIQDMNNYLDGYPLDLPCRYADKQACYTKAYIISNVDLLDQYKDTQEHSKAVWKAFLRRINRVIKYTGVGVFKEYEKEEYLKNYFEIVTGRY